MVGRAKTPWLELGTVTTTCSPSACGVLFLICSCHYIGFVQGNPLNNRSLVSEASDSLTLGFRFTGIPGPPNYP